MSIIKIDSTDITLESCRDCCMVLRGVFFVGCHRAAFDNARALWDSIDQLQEPEPYWQIMANVIPWAFSNPLDTNSILGGSE